MENLYLTMNLFGYEKLTPPPKLLPENLTTCYITDDENISNQAKELGWSIVKKTNLMQSKKPKFKNIPAKKSIFH